MLATSKLTWVILLDPPTTKNGNSHLRKQIRSHVTRLQHARKQGGGGISRSIPPLSHQPVHDDRILMGYKICSPGELAAWTQTRLDQIEDQIVLEGCEVVCRSNDAEGGTACSPLPSVLSGGYERCTSPRFLLDPYDDLDRHLRRLGTTVYGAFNYYANVVKCQGDEFELVYSLRPGWSRGGLLPFITTDYTLLTAVSLLCITSMIPSQSRYTSETGIELLHMRHFAINAIQRAMHEQGDALTDQLVLAVCYFACYEAIYGSRASYKVHIQGLKDMIILRGGLANLGVDGLVEAVSLYVDANAAGLMGCEPWLTDFPTTKPLCSQGNNRNLFLSGLAGLEHHHVL